MGEQKSEEHWQNFSNRELQGFLQKKFSVLFAVNNSQKLIRFVISPFMFVTNNLTGLDRGIIYSKSTSFNYFKIAKT